MPFGMGYSPSMVSSSLVRTTTGTTLYLRNAGLRRFSRGVGGTDGKKT